VIFFLTLQTTVKQLVKNIENLLKRSGLDGYLLKYALLKGWSEKGK
jgi:hypothetical protein